MLNFTTAASKFATARNKYSKPLGNNTKLVKVDDDTFAVKLHHTNVVLIHRDGTYTLNSGGWRTVTTKDRINGYSPARVWQKAHVWYVNGGDRFFDGIRVNSAGTVLNPQLAAV
jgi:hypothetical protein